MWDNPRALNWAASVLVAVAATLFAFAAIRALMTSSFFPVREVVVTGDLRNLSRFDLESAARARLSGNFFSMQPDNVKAAFERLAWVRSADVRRIWPSRLEVALEEHRPMARWGEDALVNSFGERFQATIDEVMPTLAGPSGTEGIVSERYVRFKSMLAPLGFRIRQIVLTPRYAWHVTLENGLAMELGRDMQRDAVDARLARFVETYGDTLGKIRRTHEYVDLRYPNGFALRVPGIDKETRKHEART